MKGVELRKSPAKMLYSNKVPNNANQLITSRHNICAVAFRSAFYSHAGAHHLSRISMRAIVFSFYVWIWKRDTRV